MSQHFIDQYGNKILYSRTIGSRGSVILFGGWGTNINSNKAIALENYCKNNDITFTRFSYLGALGSTGSWEKQSISIWKQNCLDIINNVNEGPQIIIGSSMGGWLMLLCYLHNPSKIKGLIGIATSVNFTKRMIKNKLSKEDLKLIETQGMIKEGMYNVPISYKLLKDAPKHYLPETGILPINCPVRLIHGTEDDIVDFKLSYDLASRLQTKNIIVDIIQGADHRLNDEKSLRKMFSRVEELL